MNIVYAVKIFTALTIMVGVARLIVGPGLKLVMSPRDWDMAWWGIIGTLAVSCFSVVPLLFFATLSIWAVIFSNWLGRDGSGRLPTYVLLCCVSPPFSAELEHIGPVNDLLTLHPFRILTIFLLIPEAVRLLSRRTKDKTARWLIISDLAVYGFNLYWLLHIYAGASLTAMVRAGIGQALDQVIPYFVVSRACANGETRRRFFGFLLLGAAYEAMVAMAESTTKHYLYSQLQWLYGVAFGQATNLLRGNWLRAVAAFPGPLALAVLLMFAIGIWFVLRPPVKSKAYLVVVLSLLGGLLATLGRGPLLAAIIMLGSVWILRRLSPSKYILLVIVGCIASAYAWSAGLGDIVVAALGHASGTDEQADFNVLYRQKLLTESLALLQQSPWWGVPNFIERMQDLRQGEGIIDLVNTYLVIALNVGSFGLFMYLTPIAMTIWFTARNKLVSNKTLVREGLIWLALTVAVLTTIFTVSPVSIIQPIIIWTAAVALGRLQELRRDTPARVDVELPVLV